MYVNDPVADMLTRIRNANIVYSESVDIPSSKIKLALAKILKDEGYIRDFKIVSVADKPYSEIRIYLSYGAGKERVIQGLRRISKPGRRIYVGHDKLPVVMGGLGLAVLSTSKGLKTGLEASKLGLGGEVVCYVW